MRSSFWCLAILGAAVALGACNKDSRSPTGDGPQFSSSGNGDSTGRDTTGLPSHYIANGATASADWSSSSLDSLGGFGGWMYGYVSVNRNSQVNDEWTNINWSISSCDAAWNCRYSSGYGFVHADVLAGSGGADLRLKVDPSAFPGSFYVYGDSVGLIELTWRQTSGYSSRSSGNSQTIYPGFTFRSNGVSQTSSAAVSGHIGNSVLPSWTTGTMGTNHAMTISLTH